MHRRTATALLTGLPLAGLLGRAFAADAPAEAKLPPTPPPPAEPPVLPKDIVWETNNDDPPIGSPKAIRGSRLNIALGAYPLTFRVMGPNNNDYFAAWNQAFTLRMTLVGMHPNTDRFYPMLATHWSVQPDQQTIFFKLDPDVVFSDGHKVTADDYVFALEMMRSKFIVDPFFNTYAQQFYKSIDKVDDYTIRVVGTRPSWRPLYDYGKFFPMPAHAITLDSGWVTRTNNEPQIGAGAYVVAATERGQSVTFKRVPNWWGDKKKYFQGLYNFDEIHLRIIPAERELDYVRQGELDIMQEATARIWNENYTFPAITNGWLRRARMFTDMPEGIYGLHINTEAPIFQNRDFRVALQYLFNFDRLNRNLMYSEYFRINSFFAGTEFANPDVKAYPFDPVKAQEYLARAGYHRPKVIGDQSVLGRLGATLSGLIFTRNDTDDILVNDKGEKASFTLLYSSKGIERHLTVMQQEYRRAGVDIRLQLLEDGSLFERGLERKFEMFLVAMTSDIYPDPRQYLHTDFKKAKNNNDFWGFGTEEVDNLIKTYEDSQNADERRNALWRVDQIVHDEAFYIPFWTAPYKRLVYWDYIQFPDTYLPRRTDQYMDYMVWWIDLEKRKALEDAMRDGKAYSVDPELDKDPWQVREKFK